MAPEIILGDAEVDRRADVYALGCVAYFLLTGELVFEADTSMKMLMQHLHAQPVPPSQRTELPIPRELDELVLACLQKDPKQRPQNAGELFRMAKQLPGRATSGTRTTAERWWRAHLPQLTGPLASHSSAIRPRRRAVVSADRDAACLHDDRRPRPRPERACSIAPLARHGRPAGEGVSALLLAANVFLLLALLLTVAQDRFASADPQRSRRRGRPATPSAGHGRGAVLVFVPLYSAFASASTASG